MVRLLANPLVWRGTLVLFMAGCAFVFAIFLIRRLRRNLAAEADLDSATPHTLEALPVHLYNTVIQQLKQQKHELQVQTLTEQRRARVTENFSQTVLSNLPSGVLVFGLNGLVKQANPAAKEILGFRSLSGMSAEDIFRDAAVCSPKSTVRSNGPADLPVRLVEEVHAVLREGSKRRQLEADYTTPAGEKLHIAVTVSAVPAVDGSLLGAACLISDRSEFEHIRRQQQLHGEISAEMALELRTSLSTIAGYAQQLARNRDPDLAPQLAADIAGEAASLDRRIGGFLAAKRTVDAGTVPIRPLESPDHENQQEEPLNGSTYERSQRMEAMKRITHVGFVFALFTVLAASPAAAQTTTPATTPVPDQSSLGDYARKVHKDPSAKAKPKVFDNDNLPKDDKLSIVGEPAPAGADATASAESASKAAAAPTDSKDTAGTKPADAEQAKKQAEWKAWQEKLSAQKNSIDLASRELDVLQKEYQLRAAVMYADAGNRLRNSTQWDKEEADYKQKIADKQKAVDDAKQKLDDLEEEARKAGVPAAMREP
ncbi:MAG: PAS domain-containing protein [Candidatus Sulfotelmatobacter sp.]